MFSPMYFEKLDAFIECLNDAAEIAYQHAEEIALEYPDSLDLTPVCSKCLKRRKRNFEDFNTTSQHDFSYTSVPNEEWSTVNNSIQTQQSNRVSSANKDQLSSAAENNQCDVRHMNGVKQGRHNAFKKDKNATDSTFMSALMKTLVTLNSSSESLNLSRNLLNRSVNETSGKKKKAFLKRRHTMLIEKRIPSSADAGAAVDGGKNNATCDTVNTEDNACMVKNTTTVLRSHVARKPRPYSYPNQDFLRRQINSDNVSRGGAKNICKPPTQKEKVASSEIESMEPNIADVICGEKSEESSVIPDIAPGEVQTEDESTTVKIESLNETGEKSPHQIYYSLSPLLADSPLKIEDLAESTVSAVKVSVKDGNPADRMTSNIKENIDPGTEPSAAALESVDDTTMSHDSSLSSNPEYFAIITKNRRRRKRLGRTGQSEATREIQSASTPAKIETAVEPHDVISCEGNSLRGIGHVQPLVSGLQSGGRLRPNVLRSDGKTDPGNSCNSVTGDTTTNLTQDGGVNGSTSYHHGDGLLYTSSFGIGDHAWCANLAESDMTKDGYCKCSFCNHDMIITPMKSDTYDVITKADNTAGDLNDAHLDMSRLRSCNTPDSVAFVRASDYPSTSDLQADHFPYPRLPKEFMTSECDTSLTSQTALDVSMEVACSCDNDSVASDDDKSNRRVSPTQKALQRDIEKHSSGVASVLNLCEVLLHDGDACSTEAEKESIEQATSSLDRRWRNICSLSMERKLRIEETQRLWQKFMEDYSRFSDWLRSAEHVVTHPNTFMTSYSVAREELKKFESFQRQVHESLTQLELINKQYRRLARENRTDATNKLKQLIHDGNSRWDSLSHRVTSILRRLKHAIHRREEFETQRESLLVWLTETDLRLTNVEHFMQSENYDKLKEVKNFQAAIEEHIPNILQLDTRGQHLLEKSEETDCVTIEEELKELHRYCREVVARLDRYHKRLLRIMNEPAPLDSSLFEDTEMANFNWWGNYVSETSSSRNSSPVGPCSPDRLAPTPKSQSGSRLHSSPGSHSGRGTPESLEWDLYDMSQSELETKDTGDMTDDASIPEISPLETASDDVPLLHVSRDSAGTVGRNNTTRRSHELSTSRELEIDDLSSPAKKQRTSQDEQRVQFMNDLIATLAWLDATEKVTDQERKRTEANFDKTINDLSQEVKELKSLQKSIEQRKAIVLSINLVSSSFTDSDTAIKLSRMNRQWDSLQKKSMDWNRSLQESLTHSQEFQSTISGLSGWIDLQNQCRDDMTMSQQKESANSSPSSKMQNLRKNHKALDRIRIETLEAISKVTTMQEICIQLTSPADGDRVDLVEGTRGFSEKVRSTNGRLKALLDGVRSDLRDMEHRIKATRRRAREEHSSASDSESSTDTPLRASTPIRLRMLQRKVEASELHSCGRNPNLGSPAESFQEDDVDGPKFSEYDITQESCSSIDSAYYDVTHKSLHSGSKENRQPRHTTTTGKAVATKQTVIATEKKEKAITVSTSTTRITSPVYITDSLNSGKACGGFCCRVCIAALPFYAVMVLLFLLPWLLQASIDDGYSCFRQNNYAFSFTPMLTYTNGPPPV